MKETLTDFPRVITPAPYPTRRETLMGLPAFQGEEAKKISQALVSDCFPIRYDVTLTTRRGNMLVMGQVVCHVDLEVWCDWHGYNLFTLDAPPTLALEGERTTLG